MKQPINDPEKVDGSLAKAMGKDKNRCLIGKKPKELGLGKEPESAFRPIELEEDDEEIIVRPVPEESYTIRGMKRTYVPLEKIAEKLRLVYDAFDSKPDWNTDSDLVNILDDMPVNLKKNFEITFYSKGEILKVTGTPHLKRDAGTCCETTVGYDIFVEPTTQVQKQLIDLLKV